MPRWALWRRSPSNAVEPMPSVSDPLFAVMLRNGLIGDGATPVTESGAMGLSAVFRAVSLVSGSIAALPLRTLKTNPDGTRERVTSWLDNPGHTYSTPFEWKELGLVHLLLHGRCFGQHIYNGGGALVGMNWVHPLGVKVFRDEKRIGGRRFEVPLDDGEVLTFDASTMTQVMGISLDGVTGISPITYARLSLSGAIAGDRAAHQVMTHGAMISGLVTPDADEDLSEGEAKTIKKTVTEAMTGVENAGAVAVINRKLRFQPWQMSAVDAQFMASRAFSIEEIGRWYGVPPHLLGQTEKQTSWGTGVSEQNRGLSRYTLDPWTKRIEQRMSRQLTGPRIAEFDFSAFVAPSPEDEIRLLLEQVNGGLVTPNEARRIRNMPPIKGGDKLRVPAGATDPNAPAPAGDDAPPSEEDA